MIISMQPLPETPSAPTGLPEKIRVSSGTAIVLGLLEGKLDAQPTTAYLMTYKDGKCTANCGFCPQATASKSNTELLSRVTWPTFPTAEVLQSLCKTVKQGKIKRVCIQALNYWGVFMHLEAFVKEVKKSSAVPVSVSCQPLNTANIELLSGAGVDRLGIALDAATEELFSNVKGKAAGCPYSWESQFRQLNEALRIFGKGNVSTHLIVGLGETEKQMAQVIQRCVDIAVLPALFAFTPIRGTTLQALPPPPVDAYRRIQLARHLLVHNKTRVENMHFDGFGKIIGFGVSDEVFKAIVEGGLPFQTSGCPDCNRPFYNERPGGIMYNYAEKLSQKDIEKVKGQL
jgi:lipoyl synthase